jgi:hypothetical protein
MLTQRRSHAHATATPLARCLDRMRARSRSSQHANPIEPACDPDRASMRSRSSTHANPIEPACDPDRTSMRSRSSQHAIPIRCSAPSRLAACHSLIANSLPPAPHARHRQSQRKGGEARAGLAACACQSTATSAWVGAVRGRIRARVFRVRSAATARRALAAGSSPVLAGLARIGVSARVARCARGSASARSSSVHK